MKQPFAFEVGNKELFAFAGLWDEWKAPQSRLVKSCTILTTEANSLVAEMHDRMPVIVPPERRTVVKSRILAARGSDTPQAFRVFGHAQISGEYDAE